jgi:hypothetical protein
MTNPSQPVHHETTYQMLIESEEKERGLIEDIVYLLLVIATVATIWQFSHQPVTFADVGVMHAQKVAALLRS